MKKILIAIICLLIAVGAVFLYWQNTPEKRYARHIINGRNLIKQNNYSAAQKEYIKAYSAKEGNYSPYVSLEVLRLENALNLQNNNLSMAINNTRQFVEAHPKNMEGRLILSRLAFKANQPDLAFESLLELIKRDPSHFEARFLLAQVRARQGRYDLAEEQLRVLHKSFPDSISALIPLAGMLSAQGQNVAARELLQDILQKDPKMAAANLNLVDSYLRDRMPDSAKIWLEAWAEIDSLKEMPILIRKARLHSVLNELEEAENILHPYLKARESNVPALSELAIIKAKQGKYDSASTIYLAIGELDHKLANGNLFLAHLLELAAGNPAKALQFLKTLEVQTGKKGREFEYVQTYVALDQDFKAIELIQSQNDTLKKVLTDFMSMLEPNKNFIGQWALNRFFQLTSQKFWVVQTAQNLYRQWPRNALAVDLYTKQLISIGQKVEALEILEKQAKLSLPQELTLVTLNMERGNTVKTQKLLERLKSKYPSAPGINSILASFHQKTDSHKYVSLLQKELDIDSNNIVALNNLAWQFGIEEKNLEKAKPFVDKLLASNQNDPRVMDTAGWILAKNGKLDSARHHIQYALNIVPDHPAFLYHMGWIESQAGNEAKAQKNLKAALDSKLKFEERAEADSLYQQYLQEDELD